MIQILFLSNIRILFKMFFLWLPVTILAGGWGPTGVDLSHQEAGWNQPTNTVTIQETADWLCENGEWHIPVHCVLLYYTVPTFPAASEKGYHVRRYKFVDKQATRCMKFLSDFLGPLPSTFLKVRKDTTKIKMCWPKKFAFFAKSFRKSKMDPPTRILSENSEINLIQPLLAILYPSLMVYYCL